MLTKPLNLIIVYILTIINFVILLIPFATIIILAVKLNQQFLLDQINQINIIWVLNFMIFLISFLMILYLFLDFLFGFSLRSSLKNCKNYKSFKKMDFLTQIFQDVQKKFNRSDVKLYISENSQINAFAVGSMRKKVIVLTTGLIKHSFDNSKDKKEFLIILRSIMGHEMSHLVNKDYLPGLLIIINQKVTNLVSYWLELIIRLPVIILGYIRIRSRIFLDIALIIYSIINRIVTFFNEKIIFNFYEFIRRFVSRAIEYRCDHQSAHAFGGHNMALALSLFGSNGYFTLFSTHPNTQLRIKKVTNIRQKNSKISPLISSAISNYFALMFLVIICAVFAKKSKIDIFIRHNHEELYYQILNFIQKIQYYLNLFHEV